LRIEKVGNSKKIIGCNEYLDNTYEYVETCDYDFVAGSQCAGLLILSVEREDLVLLDYWDQWYLKDSSWYVVKLQ
jgi:hypothetical protein